MSKGKPGGLLPPPPPKTDAPSSAVLGETPHRGDTPRNDTPSVAFSGDTPHRGDTLRRLLFRRMLWVFLFLVAFFILNRLPLGQMNSFITSDLQPDMEIYRGYENLLDFWDTVNDQVASNTGLVSPTVTLMSEESQKRLEDCFGGLEKMKRPPDRRQQFLDIQGRYGSYFSSVNDLRKLLEDRNGKSQKASQKRAGVKKDLGEKAEELTQGCKDLVDDIASFAKDPLFQNTFDRATPLMTNVSRIEKDLIQVQGEIILYFSSSERAGRRPELHNGEELPNRVIKRLNAVINLMERSTKETKSPVSLRVFQGIQKRIFDIRRVFLESLSTPDTEVTDLDDQIRQLETTLQASYSATIDLVLDEARYYWNRIEERAERLLKIGKFSLTLTQGLLALALIAGLYTLIIFPGQISRPLLLLKDQVQNFRLGKEFAVTPEYSSTREIEDLSLSFHKMTHDLQQQVLVNASLIGAIEKIGRLYRDLQDDALSGHPFGSITMQEAIGTILVELLKGMKGLDLCKVMIWEPLPKGKPGEKSESPLSPGQEETSFVRLGDTVFSEDFKKTREYEEYVKSLPSRFSPSFPFEESVPPEGSATGWLATTTTGRVSSEVTDPLAPICPVMISKTSETWTFERGLKGGFYKIDLSRELSLSGDDDNHKAEEPPGLLFLYFHDPVQWLTHQDLMFAQIVARQISMLRESEDLLNMREKNRRQEYQLQLAQEIQKDLLGSSVPEVPELRVKPLNKQAYEVGGDYYECFRIGEDRYGVVIADASGKNVPAAIIMTVFKTALATMGIQNLSAGQVLEKANNVILDFSLDGRFITAMYVIIHLRTGEVELACAGHHPALVGSPGEKGPPLEMSTSGYPLGIDRGAYESIRFKLKPGDCMLLYTDGVTEARNPDGEEFEMKRLNRFMKAPHGIDPPQELYQSILAHAAGAPQHDDITAVWIEYLGKEHEKRNRKHEPKILG